MIKSLKKFFKFKKEPVIINEEIKPPTTITQPKHEIYIKPRCKP